MIQMIGSFEVHELDNSNIMQYVDIVCSDWYCKWSKLKYDGKTPKEIIAKNIMKVKEGRYALTFVGSNKIVAGFTAKDNNEEGTDEIVLSYFVIPAYQRKGFGKVIISHLTKVIEGQSIGTGKQVALYIKHDNIASKSLAKSCGYRKDERYRENGVERYIHVEG